MLAENAEHLVIRIATILRHVHSSELNKAHLSDRIKQPPGDKNVSAKVVDRGNSLARHRTVAAIVPDPLLRIVVPLLLCGSAGHAIRFTSARVELSTGAPVSDLAGDDDEDVQREAEFDARRL